MSFSIDFETANNEDAQRIGILMVQALQKQLTGPKHGLWYPAPGNPLYQKMTPKNERASNYELRFTGTPRRNEIMGAAYQASAPGEAPASRTGRLRQSFIIVINMLGTHHYKVSVKSNVYYADDMQFGTAKVAARPFADLALIEVLPQITDIQLTALGKVIR
jgi:hypothetical protein